MCGIVGILGTSPVSSRLMEALKRLEYRGYDSAGVATLVQGRIERRRAEGKLANLEILLKNQPLEGNSGIGHTRWATHGAPVEMNAHPHVTGRVAVVHNGIIENFQELRDELSAKGIAFTTETDTEAVAHLITHYMEGGEGPVEATAKTLGRLKGAYALAILFSGEEDLMIGAREGTPLCVGYGEGEMYLGSDAIALSPLSRRIAFLEEGDWAVLTRQGVEVRNAAGTVVKREVRTVAPSAGFADKGHHRHFMAKEIFEQPETLGHAFGHYIRPTTGRIEMDLNGLDLSNLSQATITACGTASFAGLVAKFWFERLAGLPTEVDVASEFRYREPPLAPGGLTLVISQSGETADTLAALRYCRRAGRKVAAIVNVPESTMAREADAVLPICAGVEIGVASTKAFTGQLAVLAALAVAAARARGRIGAEEEARLASELLTLPRAVADTLNRHQEFDLLGQDIAEARDVLFIGRGDLYPIALEGALKLKEISYIHAEGYPAGEMKHGPIALIDENVPIVVLAPPGPLFDKVLSNAEEAMARGGKVVMISDKAGCAQIGNKAWRRIEIPDVPAIAAPILYTVPMQLFAYYAAVAMGTDVDQPRNLAKSVTVE